MRDAVARDTGGGGDLTSRRVRIGFVNGKPKPIPSPAPKPPKGKPKITPPIVFRPVGPEKLRKGIFKPKVPALVTSPKKKDVQSTLPHELSGYGGGYGGPVGSAETTTTPTDTQNTLVALAAIATIYVAYKHFTKKKGGSN